MRTTYLLVVALAFFMSISQPLTAFSATGACTNSSDLLVPKKDQSAAATRCGRDCWGERSCTADCMEKKLPLSEGCADCWGRVIECGAKYCKSACLFSSTSPGCLSCIAKNQCDRDFSICSGI